MIQDFHPLLEKESKNHLFAYVVRQDNDGTIYVNLTGTFPLHLIDGMTTVFI